MILQFKDEYRWLSNFWYFEKPFEYQGLVYPTNEHFYVAMKTIDQSLREKVADHSVKGLKRFGATLQLRDDWENLKLNVMSYGIRYKFSKNNPTLRQLLIDTGNVYIQEGNYWGDTFWGVDLKTGKGENHLGVILMQVRKEIRKDEGFY